MKLIYLANVRLPTEKAHGLQIMKTCEALVEQGVEVELVIPRRRNHLKDDPFVFYGVEKKFKITIVWSWDLVTRNLFGFLGFWLQSWTFYRSVKKYLQGQKDVVYYTRDLSIAYWLSKKIRPLYYEIHTLPDVVSKKYRMAWQRAAGLVVISNGLKQELIKQARTAEKILVAHDAVDPDQFQIKESREECRKKLNVPLDKKVVVYTGHLYEWKGADVLAQAAARLPPDCAVYLVGGTAEDIERFKKQYNTPSLHIVGWQKHEMIPYWLTAADVLVLPNSAKSNVGSKYTSPLKAFEYRVADRPIVASDLPAMREALNGASRILFVEPDSAEKLAVGVRQSLSVPEEPVRNKESTNYSWEKRAELIKNFIFNY